RALLPVARQARAPGWVRAARRPRRTPRRRARGWRGAGAVSWVTQNRGEDEGPEMRPGELRRDLEQERQGIAGLFGGDDRVHEAAGPGEAGVELMLVVSPHRLDGRRPRKVTSEARGREAPPALHGRSTAAICGTRR